MSRDAERRHRLLLELGRGGMGTVYLAALPQGELVVVKRLRADKASQPHFLQGFLDESRLAMTLHHPNIVRTREIGFDSQHYFIEMDYLEGQSLEALSRAAMARSGLGWPLSLHILERVLAGLHHAHEMTDAEGNPLRIVHRDVSPHNVLVTYDGAVKLLDFGIAKASTSSHDTSTGVIKGKLTYMAPEQAARRPIDRRADVFSVGVMLWQFLTGFRLWEDVPEALLFHKLDRGEIAPPRILRHDVPEALEAICMKALALEPDARFASADDMRRALAEERRARWGEVDTKDVAALMSALFGGQRASDRTQIEARRAEGAELGNVEPPGDEQPPGDTVTRTDPSRARAHAPRPRRLRRWLGACASAVATPALLFSLGGRTAEPDAETGCTSNAQCMSQHDGKAFRCGGEHTCVPLEAPGCQLLAEPGNVENDATLWIGTMFPMSGRQANTFGMESVHAADRARRDFMQIAGGIPAPAGASSARARPIALIACDDADDPKRVARHLVGAGVSAVVGFSASQEVIDLATGLFIPNGVLSVATQNRSSLIATIPHPTGTPRLVWRTTVNAAANALPVSTVVSEVLERELRAAGIVGAGEPMRVASLRVRNTTGLTRSDALLGLLRFNGKSAVDNGANFREVLYTAPGDPKPIADAAVVDALLSFRPHVIISPGFDSNTNTVLAPLESKWSRGERFRPRYVMTGMYGEDFFRFLGKDAERRKRFLGVGLPTSSPANAAFTSHYNASYAPKVTQSGAPGAVYDAIYLLAYAAVAAGDHPMTGPNLARAMNRLVPPGKPLDVGPANILEAFAALQRGESIDLQGAATPLDFDPTTGESPTDFALLCVGSDARGAATEAMESGAFFRATTKTIEGLPVRCP